MKDIRDEIGEHMKTFEYTEVESSNIAQIGYMAEDELLEIMFHSNEKYWYVGVPSDVVDNLLTAESVGKYFNAHIKKGKPYPFIKVTGMKQDLIFDAVNLANAQRVGTIDYKRFSVLCEIMGWDYFTAWDMSAHRLMWLEYQDDKYLEVVHKMAKGLKEYPATSWPHAFLELLNEMMVWHKPES
jgi:hypothetical protein